MLVFIAQVLQSQRTLVLEVTRLQRVATLAMARCAGLFPDLVGVEGIAAPAEADRYAGATRLLAAFARQVIAAEFFKLRAGARLFPQAIVAQRIRQVEAEIAL